MKYKADTCRKYLSGLSKALSRTNCGIIDYRQYYLLYNAYETAAQNKTALIEPQSRFENVVNYLTLIQNVRSNYSQFDKYMKFFSLIMLESVDWHKHSAIGILRMSDLCRSSFINEEGRSYIDIKRKLWFIKADATKNSTDREIILSDTFVNGVLKIFDHNLPKTPFPEGSSEKIVDSITKTFGYGPKIIRRSYATYLYTCDVPMNRFVTICNNMGHSHQTSCIYYIGNK